MTFLSISIILIFLLLLISGIVFGIYHFARDISQGLSGYGIPYIHTPEKKIQKLLEYLDLKDGDTFIDIGCGNGAVLEAVKMNFGKAKVIGYEKSYRPYQDALKKRAINALDYEIRYGDFFESNAKDATVLYSYMIHYMMNRIWKKITSECRPGTILISSSFPVASIKAKEILDCGDNRKYFIYEVGDTIKRG